MRTYLFGTGILTAITSGIALLRDIRAGQPFTWRTGLAWLSWAITLTLAIGAIVDVRRARRGSIVAADSPVAGRERKLAARFRR